MEYLQHLFSTVVISISAFFGVQSALPPEPQVTPQNKAEQRADISAQEESEEDVALDSALSELRGIQEKLKQPEVIEGMPVQYPKKKPVEKTLKEMVSQQMAQQQVKQLEKPSFVQAPTIMKTYVVEPTTGSPLASSFAPVEASGAILFKPLPHPNIELQYREVPASISSQYELEWDIPETLSCSVIVYRYKSTEQVSSTWIKSVTGKGKKTTDPLYQDQRYRLLCTNPKGGYLSDTILFRTRSTVRSLPTCTIVPSKAVAQDGERITYTIGGSDIETFAFGIAKPVPPEEALRFPFTREDTIRKGAQPFTVTVGNRLGTSTCNAIVKVE